MSAGDTMQGRRIHGRDKDGDGKSWYAPEPGDYWHDGQSWMAETPNGLRGALSEHDVVEHEDGTITVSPSILVTGQETWHGYLDRGVWREV